MPENPPVWSIPKTLQSPHATVKLVLITVFAEPFPVMVRLSLTSRSPEAAAFSGAPPLESDSVTVPLKSKTIVSAPAFAFEARTAERSVAQLEEPPLGAEHAAVESPVPVTWYVTAASGTTEEGATP